MRGPQWKPLVYLASRFVEAVQMYSNKNDFEVRQFARLVGDWP